MDNSDPDQGFANPFPDPIPRPLYLQTQQQRFCKTLKTLLTYHKKLMCMTFFYFLVAILCTNQWSDQIPAHYFESGRIRIRNTVTAQYSHHHGTIKSCFVISSYCC